VSLASVISEPGVIALIAYLLLLFVLTLFGSVVFAFGLRENRVRRGGVSLSAALSTFGMLAFLLISVVALL
jgi:hypothetical protein